MIKYILYINLILGLFTTNVFAQAGAGMKIQKSEKHYRDSLRRAGYPYRFPIWGSKLVQKGFEIQYPVGAMLNLNAGSQDVEITDLQVGFNDQGLQPMDFVKFGEVKAKMQSATTRLDLWLLPFLDLYGIAGYVQAQTDVNIVSPFSFFSETKFKGYTYGIGTTIAGGYHGIVSINDINHTWTHLDNLSSTVKTWMFTPRLGYNYAFKHRREKTVTLWVGTTGFYVNKGTTGSIDLSDLNPHMSQDQINEILSEASAWYKSLSPGQQVVVKRITQAIKNKIDGLPDDITVNYSLKKNPTSNWSLLVGGQFQFNRRWQVRTEVGFLGGRSSVLLSGNYRWLW